MRILAAIALLVMLGCEASYHRDRSVFSGDCEGYRETKLDSTSYIITICGGYWYENADLYVLYRAAELAVANARQHFVVVDNPPTHANIRAAKRIRFLPNSASDTMTAFNAEGLIGSLRPFIARK